MKRPVAFDLFAGCGGLSLGLRQAGFRVALANELNKHAATTYRSAHRKTLVFQEDVNDLFSRMVEGGSDLPRKGDVDLVAGGPPCQGFSGFNRFRRPSDPRNSLVESFLDIVAHLEPRYVLMENVPGILSMADGKTVQVLLKTFQELGYDADLGILQAGYYGLPQNRWRVFIWAAREGNCLPCFPEPTHSFPRKTIFGATKFRHCMILPPAEEETLFWKPLPTVTVRDAIGDLPGIENGGGEDEMRYARDPAPGFQKKLRGRCTRLHDHVCSGMGPDMLERCQHIPRTPGAGWQDLPRHLKPKNLLRHGDNRYPNRFGRLDWDGTFNTILTRAWPYWSRVFHPEQDRIISVRETARAQGFPDSVHFLGPISQRYRQIGNAVPVPLAKALGSALIGAANGGKGNSKKGSRARG